MVYYCLIVLGVIGALISGFLNIHQFIGHFNVWQWSALILFVFVAFLIISVIVSMAVLVITAPFMYLFMGKNFNEKMIRVIVFTQAGLAPLLSAIFVVINMKLLIHWVEMLPLN